MKTEVAVSRLLHRAEETMLSLRSFRDGQCVDPSSRKAMVRKKEVNTQIDSVFSVLCS